MVKSKYKPVLLILRKLPFVFTKLIPQHIDKNIVLLLHKKQED